MFMVWVYTVYGWRVVGDYPSLEGAKAEMASHKGRCYIINTETGTIHAKNY